MEFNYTASGPVLPASLRGATPHSEPIMVQCSSIGTLANVDGHTLPDGSVVSHDSELTKQTTDETMSDNKRPRSSCSNVSDAGGSGRESCRQRRRLQPQYASREEQMRATASRAVSTVAASLTDVVGRTTNDTFRTSCLSLLQVRDTRQLKEAITRKLWHLSSEKCSFDGAAAGQDGTGCVDDSTSMASAMSSSQNVDNFDDLASHLTDADGHTVEGGVDGHNSKKPRTESCPVPDTHRELVAQDWFSDIVDD